MRKIISTLSLSSTLLASAVLGGCGAPESADAPALSPAPAKVQRQALSLEVARRLATAMGQPALRSELRALLAASPRHQVALSQLADLPGGAAVLPPASRLHIEELQVSAPLDWTGDAAPLVTFVPETAEAEVTELVYFDGAGQALSLPVAERPEAPVLVVGLKEERPEAAPAPQASDRDAQAVKRLVVYQVVIRNDHEPWYKGDPEIYLRCSFPAAGSPVLLHDLPEVNRENALYTINRIVGTYSDTYGTPARCGLYESDGPLDGNDSLGTKQIWFASPYGTHSITDGWFSFTP